MKVLFWLSIGLDRQATSGHLITAMVEAVCKLGHSVNILQKGTGGGLPPFPEQLLAYGVTTDIVPFQAANKSNFIARYITELKYIRSCKQYITTEYDAVFIQSTTVAGFAVRTVRKKLPNAIVTFNIQDIFPYNAVYSGSVKKNSIVFKILAGIQRYGYKHSDHIITISEDMKHLLVEDGVESSKIDVIYNWSYQDEPYENVDLTSVAQMFNPLYFNVVYAGNIGVMQNVDILIEAAKLMKDDKEIWFHVIGNGVYKDKLEARAREYGISNISFWPMQPPGLAPAIYSSADVNVITLVKDVYKTALPSKTATCLACGKPIIFAIGKDSKFGQMIAKETGCVVTESDNASQLANSIMKVKTGDSATFQINTLFRKEFGITRNSEKYAKIITKKVFN